MSLFRSILVFALFFIATGAVLTHAPEAQAQQCPNGICP
jgi:hypothetical protein